MPEKNRACKLESLRSCSSVLSFSGLRICGLNDLPAKLRNSLPHSDLTPVKIKEKKMAGNAFKLLIGRTCNTERKKCCACRTCALDIGIAPSRVCHFLKTLLLSNMIVDIQSNPRTVADIFQKHESGIIFSLRSYSRKFVWHFPFLWTPKLLFQEMMS